MLRLFTSNYPYGFGESFLNNELPGLEKEFDEVVIYPYSKAGNIQSAFEGKHKIILDEFKEHSFSLNFADNLFVLRVLLIEVLNSGKGGFVLKNFRKFGAQVKKGVLLSKWIERQELRDNDAYYSFWMNEWALALAILKKRTGSPNFVMRMNGWDIYNERHEGNYLPFRYFIYTQVTKAYTPSPTSTKYIKELNMFPEKMSYSFFGTKDYGPAVERTSNEYTIFSCSSAIPLKRLEKIADVILQLKFPVKWVHHGDGPTFETVLQKMNSAPDYIQFEYTSKVDDYEEVLLKQKNLAPDLFINLSTTEGLPVTFIEAMSFGVPILANDVGSCRDVITPLTGILVGSEDTPEKIAKEITKLQVQNKRMKDGTAIRDYWKENFYAETNYVRFAQEIKKQLFGN